MLLLKSQMFLAWLKLLRVVSEEMSLTRQKIVYSLIKKLQVNGSCSVKQVKFVRGRRHGAV